MILSYGIGTNSANWCVRFWEKIDFFSDVKFSKYEVASGVNLTNALTESSIS